MTLCPLGRELGVTAVETLLTRFTPGDVMDFGCSGERSSIGCFDLRERFLFRDPESDR